jgi:hypothetical protein
VQWVWGDDVDDDDDDDDVDKRCILCIVDALYDYINS